MANIQITRFALAREGQAYGKKQDGEVLARFDVQLSAVHLSGCRLVRGRQGGFLIVPPMPAKPWEGKPGIYITDNEIRDAILDAALVIFGGFGGDTTWRNRTTPEGEAPEVATNG